MKLMFWFMSIILLVSVAGFIFEHERAHVEVYKHYGINSTVDYWASLFRAETMPGEPCPNDQCVSDQNQVDIVGSHLQPFLLLFGAFAVFSLIVMEGIYNTLEGIRDDTTNND